MKKLLLALLVFVLILAMSATALATNYYIKTQNGGKVNIRAGRGTNYDKIGTLSHGELIDVVNIKNGWAKFNYGAYGYGYVSANYISKDKPAAAAKNSNSGTTTVVSKSSAGTFDLVKSYNKFVNVSYKAIVQPSTSSNNINMRWAPSTGAPIMGLRRAGSELKVIAQNGTWCQVVDETTGECGFMMKKFLLEVTDVTDPVG